MPTINGKFYNDVIWAAAQRSQVLQYPGFERPSEAGWLLGMIRAYHDMEEQLLAGGAELGRLVFFQNIPDETVHFSHTMADDGMQGIKIYAPRLN
jgi:hypothetical protein